jgi:hypothetical protein
LPSLCLGKFQPQQYLSGCRLVFLALQDGFGQMEFGPGIIVLLEQALTFNLVLAAVHAPGLDARREVECRAAPLGIGHLIGPLRRKLSP